VILNKEADRTVSQSYLELYFFSLFFQMLLIY